MQQVRTVPRLIAITPSSLPVNLNKRSYLVHKVPNSAGSLGEVIGRKTYPHFFFLFYFFEKVIPKLKPRQVT